MKFRGKYTKPLLFFYQPTLNAKTPFLRHLTEKTALKNKPHPLLNPPKLDFPSTTGHLDKFEGEETENRGAVILNCGRMPCAPTDEFTVVPREDLRGFKNLEGLVGIIGKITSTVCPAPMISVE